jgi:hypothetical protein
MELSGLLYVRCRDSESRNRLQYYLDARTRPDFSDEVPEAEADLVNVFEAIDEPIRINQPSSTELLATFDMLAGEPGHEIAPVMDRFHLEQALWYESDGGDVADVSRYEKGRFHFLCNLRDLEDEVDESDSSDLPPQILEHLRRNAFGDATSSILYLGRNLKERSNK